MSRGIILSAILLVGFGVYRYLLPERSMGYTGFRALADSFFAIGLLIVVLLVGGGIGLKIIRWLGIVPSSYLETIAFAVPVGLGVFSYGILALGLLGLLDARYLILWFVVLFFLSYQEWRELAFTGVVKMRRAFSGFGQVNIGKKLLISAFIIILALSLLQALAPPWDTDGLMYHLQGPRLFLDTGRILPLPDTWGANGPFTIEMLYMFGLRFGSDTFAKLMHLSYAFLLAIGTFSLGRRLLGEEGGWIAAAILVAIPIFPVWASLAYADMAWAVYELLGFYALILWMKSLRRGWLVLAGIAIGFAMGSKYLALGSAGILGLVILWASRKQGLKLIIQNAAIFGGVALLVCSPWYLKNWLWTGNPVYPLYFGGLQWPAERVHLLMAYLNDFGTGHKLSDYLLLPWYVYARNELYSTFLGSIETPSFLFPLLIFFPLVPHNKYIRLLGIVVLMRLVVWLVGSQQIRFLLPVFPGLCLLMASIFIGTEKKFLQYKNVKVLKVGLIGGVVVATLLYSIIFLFLVKPFGVFWGSESKFQFINRRINDIPAISYIEKHLASSDRAQFLWDGRGYYCDQRCLPDTDHSKWTRLAMAANYDAASLSTLLHQSGITHLLLSAEDVDFILQHDPTGENAKAALFFLNEFEDQCTELIYGNREYGLYKITCPPLLGQLSGTSVNGFR